MPFIGSLILVTGVLLAGPLTALAGKAPPTAMMVGGGCEEQTIQDEVHQTVYDGTFVLDHNKGRWLFVMAEVRFGDGSTLATNYPTPMKVDARDVLPVEATTPAQAARAADMVLTFTDRKGDEIASQEWSICTP
jgi:hypothetical protein